MKKLRLDLDALAVESFSTRVAEHAEGTVQGQDAETQTDSCGQATCGTYCSWTNGVWACRSVCGPACGA